jgi:uncharacterized protein (DUF1330 family)
MTVYAFAQITITDRTAYNRYQSRFMEVLNRYRGHLLVADENPSIEEGTWTYQKIILIEFPDTTAFRKWADSAEYQKIAIDRRSGSHGVVLLAQGLAPSNS